MPTLTEEGPSRLRYATFTENCRATYTTKRKPGNSKQFLARTWRARRPRPSCLLAAGHPHPL
eukprot:11184210-Lingulodinium_polyedra.AAC.1